MINKACLIRIVDHGHSSKGSICKVDYTLNISCTCGSRTQVKTFFYRVILVWLFFPIKKNLETISDNVGAFWINLGIVWSGDLVIGIGRYWAIKEKNGSWCCKSTLEDMWESHSQPSSQHSTIWSTKHNSWDHIVNRGILSLDLLLQVKYQQYIVHHSLLYC